MIPKKILISESRFTLRSSHGKENVHIEKLHDITNIIYVNLILIHQMTSIHVLG